MDVFRILIKDHRDVDRLFEKIEKSDNRGTQHREQLFRQLQQELELHTQVEEKIFYPEMKKYTSTKTLVGEALDEHREITQILQEIGNLSAEDDQWSEMINELKMAARYHVREEEGRMFPAARRELDAGRIDELGRQIQEMKQKASA
jgi:iron-sulfur cluster repair protein YtfE (RIC family)